MNKPKAGLGGKGLAALIPTGPEGAAHTAEAPDSDTRIVELDVSRIDPNPNQPRHTFNEEELAELAASIAAQGLLQPVTVRRSDGGRYQLIMGERRLRATRNLGWRTIRAIIVDANDTQTVEQALVENLLRSDLNEIEVAEGLVKLQNQYAYTLTRLAERLGKSRPAVSNTLRLLELPAGVQELIRQGRLTAGHGRSVLAFPAEQRQSVAQASVEQGLSVRELERLASSQATLEKKSRKRSRPGSTASASAASDLKAAEEQLIAYLATKVSISAAGRQGSISITFHGDEDLRRLLDLLLAGSSPF